MHTNIIIRLKKIEKTFVQHQDDFLLKLVFLFLLILYIIFHFHEIYLVFDIIVPYHRILEQPKIFFHIFIFKININKLFYVSDQVLFEKFLMLSYVKLNQFFYSIKIFYFMQ